MSRAARRENVREAWAAFDGEPDPGDGGDANGRDVPWFPAWLALRQYYGAKEGPPIASTLDHIVAAVAG